jgi:energy-coupling factor transport system permease protein
VLVVGGLVGVCIGLYGVLDGGSPARVGPYVLAAGLVLAIGGFLIGGSGTRRTRYRPDPWRAPEWLVSAAGLAAAATFVLAASSGEPGMNLLVVPLVAPTLPLLPALGVLIAMTPAWLAPRTVDAGGRR